VLCFGTHFSFDAFSFVQVFALKHIKPQAFPDAAGH
jgi:hypothetical protein